MDQKKIDLLTGRIFAGDRAAEDELLAFCIGKYQDHLRMFIQNRIGENNPDWENILQDTYLRLIVSFRKKRYVSTENHLRNFLWQTMNWAVKDYFKVISTKVTTMGNDAVTDNCSAGQSIKKSIIREVGLEEHQQDESDKSPENSLLDKEREEIINKSIQRLKKKYQKILYERYYKGKEPKEIAQEWGMPPDKIYELHYQALKYLKRELEKTYKLFSVLFFSFVIII